MTIEELEKLEALHAAATPGEWTPDIDQDRLTVDLASRQRTGDEPHDWIAPYVAGFEASDGGIADCEAIAALHNAFPAVAKALREAWAERDQARAEAAQLREVIKTARARLTACGWGVTEQAYQEMASVLDDLPAASEVADE